MKVLGVEFAPLNIPLKRRMQTLAVVIGAGLFFFGVFWGTGLFVYLLFFTSFYYLPLLYVVWMVYDSKTPKRGGRPIGWVRRWPIWCYARDYYPVSLVKTGELDPSRNYIFGYHPHGIVCAGAFINFATDSTGFDKLYPGIKTLLLTLNMNFYIPLSRELAMFYGLISADRDSLRWMLTKQGGGNAAIIAVGGAQEALDAHKGMYVLTLRNRKGFVRCALQCGADLVPVFSFGENDIFYQVKNPPGSRLRWFQERMKAVTGLSPVIFYGRGIMQYNFGYVPFRKKIVVVMGKPIGVPKIEDPTAEDVSIWHEKYITALTELFEEHKAKCGAEDASLTVL
ncbi:2-acylglycerol O-acyltransferase 2 isoform X1 [Ixodes scapularis]|uniref:2-acylglycerol O-acyltransferase 2 isoform X1 n=1 Tax=Ixodes scapularis TaxID=6945 RepID=UPI001C38F147|nr:2-acylglycerol O-acyltransferase 2 isoform X1 [Ixodes scapularis]